MSSVDFILASASPRRVELLRQFGFGFSVVPSGAEELHDETLSAHELCQINAERKAWDIARSAPGVSVVLGADTLVTLNRTLFGKPKDEREAAQMLATLSGRTHQVVTGVCLIKEDKKLVFYEETRVTFRSLSAGAIQDYIGQVAVLDKAGAYAIQERGELIVERVDGSVSNVIGLPVEKLAEALCEWNLISPLERDRIVGSQLYRSPGTAAWFPK